MSHKPPPLQSGKIYHLYNRGINRGNIFFQERNYRFFLQLYTKHTYEHFDTFAYCLLRNHFHFLVRVKTPGVSAEAFSIKHEKKEKQDNQSRPRVKPQGSPPTPSQAFGNCLNAYAKAINKTYGRTGSLFQQRFGRIEVKSDTHFLQLITYIHRNPQKHGVVKDFREWPFSSYHALISDRDTRLNRAEVLKWFDGDPVTNSLAQFIEFHDREVNEFEISPLVEDDFD